MFFKKNELKAALLPLKKEHLAHVDGTTVSFLSAKKENNPFGNHKDKKEKKIN